MHIPDSMLNGAVCPVTATLSAIGIIAATYYAYKSKDKPTALSFGAITALIFAGQMMNFAIMDGTSGHLLGGVLAASLLGTPFGVLAIALVVTVQSLVFSDGGLTVLGANIFNMAILGAGVGGLLRTRLANQWQGEKGGYLATLVAAWFSVVLASFAVSVELAIDGQIAFDNVLPAMMGVHAMIGVGEAIITLAACLLLSSSFAAQQTHGKALVTLAGAAVVALLLSPFASGHPDGLEWVAEKYSFLQASAPTFVSPLPDYTVPALGDAAISTGLAGLLGVIITFVVAFLMVRLTGLAFAKHA